MSVQDQVAAQLVLDRMAVPDMRLVGQPGEKDCADAAKSGRVRYRVFGLSDRVKPVVGIIISSS